MYENNVILRTDRPTTDRLDQIQDGGWPPSWKTSNGDISGTDRPIDFVFDPRVGFSGTADRIDLLPVVPNPRFGCPPSWKISNDHISGMHFHELQSSFGGMQEKIMREE